MTDDYIKRLLHASRVALYGDEKVISGDVTITKVKNKKKKKKKKKDELLYRSIQQLLHESKIALYGDEHVKVKKKYKETCRDPINNLTETMSSIRNEADVLIESKVIKNEPDVLNGSKASDLNYGESLAQESQEIAVPKMHKKKKRLVENQEPNGSRLLGPQMEDISDSSKRHKKKKKKRKENEVPIQEGDLLSTEIAQFECSNTTPSSLKEKNDEFSKNLVNIADECVDVSISSNKHQKKKSKDNEISLACLNTSILGGRQAKNDEVSKCPVPIVHKKKKRLVENLEPIQDPKGSRLLRLQSEDISDRSKKHNTTASILKEKNDKFSKCTVNIVDACVDISISSPKHKKKSKDEYPLPIVDKCVDISVSSNKKHKKKSRENESSLTCPNISTSIPKEKNEEFSKCPIPIVNECVDLSVSSNKKQKKKKKKLKENEISLECPNATTNIPGGLKEKNYEVFKWYCDECIDISLSSNKRSKKKKRSKNNEGPINKIIGDCVEMISYTKKSRKKSVENREPIQVPDDSRLLGLQSEDISGSSKKQNSKRKENEAEQSNEVFLTESILNMKDEVILPDNTNELDMLDYELLVDKDPLDLYISSEIADSNKKNEDNEKLVELEETIMENMVENGINDHENISDIQETNIRKTEVIYNNDFESVSQHEAAKHKKKKKSRKESVTQHAVVVVQLPELKNASPTCQIENNTKKCEEGIWQENVIHDDQKDLTPLIEHMLGSRSPLSNSSSPLSRGRSPLSRCGSLLSKDGSPLSRCGSLLSKDGSPFSSDSSMLTISPLSSPYFSESGSRFSSPRSLSRSYSPLSETKSHRSRSCSPLSETKSPRSRSCSPLSETKSPVTRSNSLLFGSDNLVSRSGSPLEKKSLSVSIRPLSRSSCQLSSSNSPRSRSPNLLSRIPISGGSRETSNFSRAGSPHSILSDRLVESKVKPKNYLDSDSNGRLSLVTVPAPTSQNGTKKRRRSSIHRYDLLCKDALGTLEKRELEHSLNDDERLPQAWKKKRISYVSPVFSAKRKLYNSSNDSDDIETRSERSKEILCVNKEKNNSRLKKGTKKEHTSKPLSVNKNSQKGRKKKLLSMKSSMLFSDCEESSIVNPTTPTYDDVHKDPSRNILEDASPKKGKIKSTEKAMYRKVSTPSSSKSKTLVGDIYTEVNFDEESQMSKICNYILKRRIPVGSLNTSYINCSRPTKSNMQSLLKSYPNLKVGKFLEHQDAMILIGLEELVDAGLVTDKTKLLVEIAKIPRSKYKQTAKNILGLFVGQGMLDTRLAWDICDRLTVLMSGDPYFSTPSRKRPIRLTGLVKPYQKPEDKRNAPRTKWTCDEDKELTREVLKAANYKAVKYIIESNIDWLKISEKIDRKATLVRQHWTKILKTMLALAKQGWEDELDFKVEFIEAILKTNASHRKEIDWKALGEKFAPRSSLALQNVYNALVCRIKLHGSLSHEEILQRALRSLEGRQAAEARRQLRNKRTKREIHIHEIQEHYLSLTEKQSCVK